MRTAIKTAISIKKSLFERAERLALHLNISRSHLFGRAIETFIKNHQNQILLEEINKACSDDPDPAEKVHWSRMRAQHRKIIEGDW